MTDLPDIDLEVIGPTKAVKLFPEARRASVQIDSGLAPHNTGIYFQDIPVTPAGIAALPFRMAEEKGFYKVDILKAPFPYDGIASMAELREWMQKPIDWDWFRNIDFVADLFHFSGGVYVKPWRKMAEVVAFYAPQSIADLACLAAIKIPPKTRLMGSDWSVVRQHVWLRERSINFKKSHATAYALAVGLDARRKAPAFFGHRK